jgi:hypothetical protein
MAMRRSITGLIGIAVLAGSTAAAAAPSYSVARARPAAEHVPASVHTVKLRYETTTLTSPTSSTGSGKGATVHGKKAARLVRLFDALKPVPAGTVHCDLAGGPETTVTFHGRKHTWVTSEAGCSTGGIAVARDGRSLPTLQPSKKWRTTVNHDLGR